MVRRMKPSDYLISEEDEYKILRERCGKTILDKEIRNNITYIRKELDERFIDKEELKKKIIQMINEHKKQNRDKFKLNFDMKSITVKKLEEILKLLEE